MSKAGVKAVIKEFGTQEKLAVHLGTTQQHISAWVRQGYIPNGQAKTVALVSRVPLVEYVAPDVAELIRLAMPATN